MVFCKAKPQDEAEIVHMIEQAQSWFAENGIDQWQNGYPNAETIRADIAAGNGVVLRRSDGIVSYASLSFLPEPTYAVIEGEGWREKSCAVLHRVVTKQSCKGKGYAGELFAQCEAAARAAGVKSLRVDTHRQNKPMQRALQKSGFLPRGVIYLASGAPRIAFEKLFAE